MRYPATFSALIQKLTAKPDSIDSKWYLEYVINPLLVFKKFSDLIEDIQVLINVEWLTSRPVMWDFRPSW